MAHDKASDAIAAEAGLIDEPRLSTTSGELLSYGHDPQSCARCDVYGYPSSSDDRLMREIKPIQFRWKDDVGASTVPVSPAGYAAGGGMQKDATCDLKARIAVLEVDLSASTKRYDDTVQYLQSRLTELWSNVFALQAENAALRSARMSAGWEHLPDVTAGAMRPSGPLSHNPFRSFRASGFMGMARS